MFLGDRQGCQKLELGLAIRHVPVTGGWQLLVSPQRFTTGERVHRTIEITGPPAYTDSVLSAALTFPLLHLISVMTVEQLGDPEPQDGDAGVPYAV